MPRPSRLLPALLALGLLAPAALAEPWERFRGPNGTGAVADQDVPLTFGPKENVLWKVPIPGVGNSSPIIRGDRVFLQSASADGSSRTLYSLDAKTGKVVWKQTVPGVKVKIRYDSSLASSTPTTDGEAVYVTFWDGKDILAAAYDFQKGTPLWKRNLGPFISQHGAGASPILYKDKLILANDMDKTDAGKKPVERPSVLIALDKKTGNVAWESPREAFRACYSAPFIREVPGAVPELVIVSSTAITGYDPENGTKNWEFKDWKFKGGPLRTVASPALVGDTLIASSGDGGGDRLGIGVALTGAGKDTQAKRAWENRKDLPYVPCPLSKGGHVYFVNDNGFAGCLDAKTGKRAWLERQPDAKFTASPVLIDGKVYAVSEQGDVFVFAAEPTFNLLARNSLGERVRATPAVADGKLYIRGSDHLYCIGQAAKK